MKGDIIPDDHHVTRLCGGSHIREDGTISATAFMPRHVEEYLSVNWLEFLELSTHAEALTEVRRVLATKRKIGRSARLAILNVGHVTRAVQMFDSNSSIVFQHEPEQDDRRPRDPSHSGLYGVPQDDIALPAVIASSVLEIAEAVTSV